VGVGRTVLRSVQQLLIGPEDNPPIWTFPTLVLLWAATGDGQVRPLGSTEGPRRGRPLAPRRNVRDDHLRSTHAKSIIGALSRTVFGSGGLPGRQQREQQQ